MPATPYDLETRPDTGLRNGQLGLWLALAAELMFLGALVASYVLLSVGAQPGAWPTPAHRAAHPWMAGTPIAFALSLVTVVLVKRERRRAQGGPARLWGFITLALGLVALALTALDWNLKLTTGHVPATSTFDACYFALSGVATLQLVAGLVALASLLVRGLAGERVEPARASRRAELAETLWIFVVSTGGIVYAVLYHL